jgi:small subunit ribosomal protein S3
MGQKIHPVGFRVGVTRDWNSRWYADKTTYASKALEDVKIRKFLSEKLSTAGLKAVEIERTENEINILIKVSKPGLVIGRGGAGVESLEKELKKITTAKIKITAEEIKTPEIEAQLVAEYLCRQIRRRVPYRRVAVFAVSSAIDKGAKGIKIRLSGVLSGSNTIARSEEFILGSIPLQTLRANIDYAQLDCKLLYGTVGIKVWVFKGEVNA